MAWLEGTVPTGFETTARQEVQEKISALEDISTKRGRVSFKISDFTQTKTAVSKLRSIDKLFVLLLRQEVRFTTDASQCVSSVKELIPQADWATGLAIWEEALGPLPGGLQTSLCNLESYKKRITSESKSDDRRLEDCNGHLAEKGSVPKFRASCDRHGKHSFGSP